MAHFRLNRTQVKIAFGEMGSITVSKAVRGNIFVYLTTPENGLKEDKRGQG
jgi:hypothetical protein